MKELLKFLTCGSVDDGKSTLMGRLLYDAGLLFDDQQEELEKGPTDGSRFEYADLLDGLTDEREQGITIDVAYRYFTTKERSFIVADTPGHEQYTRNMAVGASFADLAVILLDASKGIKTQTYRHARICRLMGIKSFVFAVNKMDTLDFSEDVFKSVETELMSLSENLGIDELCIIPLSAYDGDNVAKKSERMPWYDGPNLLSYLEGVKIDADIPCKDFVMPVQRVCRPNADYRGYEGEIAAGSIGIGSRVRVLPGNEYAKITSIIKAAEDKETASAGSPVTITIDRDIDISRGDVITDSETLRKTDSIEAKIIWFDDEPLDLNSSYYIKLGTCSVPAQVNEISYLEDASSGEKQKSENVEKNNIACVKIRISRKIVCTKFEELPALGRFLLINRVSNATAACGTIVSTKEAGTNLTYHATDITKELRSEAMGQKPLTIWMSGLSGAGKSTLANAVETAMHAMGRHTMLLDGDNVRLGLNNDLGFNEEDRAENIRRVAEVSKLMNDAGLIVLTAFISPYQEDRKLARKIIGKDAFFEVFVDTPIEVCESRDVKGLYKKARSGEITEFTGVSSPFERPDNPDFTIDMSEGSPEDAALLLIDKISKKIQ